jgi:hypothetical protein
LEIVIFQPLAAVFISVLAVEKPVDVRGEKREDFLF